MANASDDAKVIELLSGMSLESSESLKDVTTKLESFPPETSLKILAQLVFEASQPETSLKIFSSQMALELLHALVLSNPKRYLVPASQSVASEALRRSTNDEPLQVVPEVQESILQQTLSSNLVVSECATQTIVSCCKKLDASFTKTILDWFLEKWQLYRAVVDDNKIEASTVCVRCATAIVELAVLEDVSFRLAVPCLNLLLTCIREGDDPLLQISYLDLLEKIVAGQPMHAARQEWLQQDVVLSLVLGLAGGTSADPDPFLGGSALRIVAALCQYSMKDQHLEQFHRALHNFGTSELDRLATLDAISSFAQSSSKALELVLSDPVTTESWLSLKVAQPKLKASILISVARVLDPLPVKDANGDTVSVSQPSNELGIKLFASLGTTNGPEATELTLKLAKSPVIETRLAAYELLVAVAKLRTGGQLLFTNGDFYEFLMDRERETTKAGREGKYHIVAAILESPVKGLLADEVVKRLEVYVSQGPHFVHPARWEVAEQ